MVKYWDNLFKKSVYTPYLEMFKSKLHGALGRLLESDWVTSNPAYGKDLELNGLQGLFQTKLLNDSVICFVKNSCAEVGIVLVIKGKVDN